MKVDNDINKLDEELVMASLENSDNFYYLMKRYESRLLNYIRRLLNINLHEAEDVLQEVFIKVFKNLNGFDVNMKFSSWIYRITHNEAISHFRKNNNKDNLIDGDSEKALLLVKDSCNIHDKIVSKDTSREVQEVMRSLPKEYIDVLVLRFFEEKNYDEISDILRKPSGTVATLLNRAKKMLKEKIEKSNII